MKKLIISLSILLSYSFNIQADVMIDIKDLSLTGIVSKTESECKIEHKLIASYQKSKLTFKIGEYNIEIPTPFYESFTSLLKTTEPIEYPLDDSEFNYTLQNQTIKDEQLILIDRIPKQKNNTQKIHIEIHAKNSEINSYFLNIYEKKFSDISIGCIELK